ncbi:MAG: flippase-like domain-containing protein [Parasporobacterium sp.]|nr:flippase-like domain-containing protein [Parasporobacterium sp.]
MKSNKLNIFIIITCAAVVIGFIFFNTGADNLLENLKELKIGWVILAVLCMVLYWFFESIVLHIMLKPMHKQQKYKDTLALSVGGQYFNAITPFSTGGQPFQAYILTKQGVALGKGINALFSKFIVYQIALVLLTAILLLLRLDYFKQNISNFSLIVLIGFLVNLGVLFWLLGIAIFQKITRKIAGAIITFLAKIKILKSPESKRAYIDKELETFGVYFKERIKDIPSFLLAFLFSVLQLLSYMAVLYMLYRAFGLNEMDFLTIISAHAFVMTMAAFIPVPGAGIGAEGFFYFFMRQFFVKDGQLGVAMILWRLITFYLTIVVGVVFAFISNKTAKRMSKERTESEGQEAIEEENV